MSKLTEYIWTVAGGREALENTDQLFWHFLDQTTNRLTRKIIFILNNNENNR